jgi:hypothetical protein
VINIRRVLAPRGLWRIGCARAKHACSERGDAI